MNMQKNGRMAEIVFFIVEPPYQKAIRKSFGAVSAGSMVYAFLHMADASRRFLAPIFPKIDTMWFLPSKAK
jgi:hypothetical protein